MGGGVPSKGGPVHFKFRPTCQQGWAEPRREHVGACTEALGWGLGEVWSVNADLDGAEGGTCLSRI